MRDLLRRAFEDEPRLSITRRAAALDEADALLAAGRGIPSEQGRVWRLEVMAERAIDEARANRLESALALADQVLSTPDVDLAAPAAAARALEARARAWAWSGTDRSAARADRLFAEVADRYAALGATEWQGFVTFWRGFCLHQNHGDWPRATGLMREALAILAGRSPRRATVLSFFADLLIIGGRFDEAEQAIDEGIGLADEDDDAKTRDYLQWTAAKLSSARGDRLSTERHVREVEREGGEWLSHHGGVSFFADAAELLDRVGLDRQSRACLDRAVRANPDDDSCRQAVATIEARSGDPVDGLEALQDLMAGEWLDKSLMWRHVALQAWCLLRIGDDGAATTARHAFELAAASCGVQAAMLNEPELMTALAPPAAAAGSLPAHEVLCADRAITVRLLGTTQLRRADGAPVDLPPGRPAELVRLLAIHRRGVAVEEVVDALFGDVSLEAGRNRLRQVLHRLRSTADGIVIREGDRVRLVPAWVDVTEFVAAADRALASSGVLALRRAHAALALWCADAPQVDLDPYVPWAQDILAIVEQRRLALLDLVARDARRRGSDRELIAALRAATDQEPDSPERRAELARELHRPEDRAERPARLTAT